MKIIARIAAVLLALIGAFLLFAVVAAMSSDEGAKTGVAILYVAIALVSGFAAFKLWKVRSGSSAA
jgi:hypothetical protein